MEKIEHAGFKFQLIWNETHYQESAQVVGKNDIENPFIIVLMFETCIGDVIHEISAIRN